MAFDHLPLDRPDPQPSFDVQSSPPSPWRWVVAAVVAIAAGGALTFWWMGRSRPETTAPAPTTATDVAVGSNRPERQPMDLPALDVSDRFIAGLVTALSQHPTLARFLTTPALVRSSTLAVVQIGQGRTPSDPLKLLRPPTRAAVATGSGTLDPATYARWDTAVSALTSISPDDAAQLYVNVKPLFDQAYIELGHPGGDFDTAIARAIATLGETPDLDGDPRLLRRATYLEYEDPALRALPPVQKQFLLIGAGNRQRVMDWLHQVAAKLELTVE